MDNTQSGTERRLLLLSASGNLVSAVLGLTFAVLTSSGAILLDGLFDVTYFIAALFTLKVAQLVHREDDDRFPYGYVFFEPLVNGLKGVLILGVCLMALADAVSAVLSGGREIGAALAMLYGGIAILLCFTIATILNRKNEKVKSPLIQVDAENWKVNGAISGCVVLAFGSILILKRTQFSELTPYVDPVLVILVILFSLSSPVRMAWQALMELLNRTPSLAISRKCREIIETSLVEWPVRELFVRVIQPGRSRLVLAHVVLPEEYSIESISKYDELRGKILQNLQAVHPSTVLDMIFTGNRLWGAPTVITQSISVLSNIYEQTNDNTIGQNTKPETNDNSI